MFKTESAKERDCIKSELMQDLSKSQQEELLKTAWKKKYNFLLIKAYLGTKDRYYINFDKVIFDDDNDNDNENENENNIDLNLIKD